MTHSSTASRWRAPGRINLIGEHTDYNDGFVLPFALEAACTAAVTWIDEPVVRARSVQRDTEVVAPIDELRTVTSDWAGYVLGVVWVLAQRGARISGGPAAGLSIEVDSSVPVGSGLSSSAALVCSTATALDELLGLELDEAQLLAVTRSVENDFVGAPTGGMDQLASLRCTAGHALFCDMRSLATENVALPLAEAGLTLLVIDSRAPHRHADGEYGARRAGCAAAAELLGVPALRDVALEDLPRALDRLPEDTLRRYTRHIVTENDRVLQTVELLREQGPGAIGELLTASHASMREDYRITVPEIDVAVEALMDAGALGARMTGGGFGGCVIALIDEAVVDAAVALVRDRYREHGFGEPGHFCVDHAAAGAHPLTGRPHLAGPGTGERLR